ncbi:hypothetical protein EK599_18560 [Vibrio sp. T187]|uniref:hypothetical protein n=1 Tax=Vibrio TaxID=662 RepID=UPI0010CA14F5|nr:MULTISPECIES: hypothetical protein [Vibrio]MBW3697691.1 hypothetical protein [Vibrio sp. T187]
MAKRFCKLNRRDISEHLGEIHSLVTEPKFVCRSCARSSADKNNLCKPAAIPPASCQSKPDAEKVACGLLAETLPSRSEPVTLNVVAAEAPQPVAAEMLDKKSLKKAKKALKKQKKHAKALAKVVKKQQKLLKKHQSLEKQFSRLNQSMDNIESATFSAGQVH